MENKCNKVNFNEVPEELVSYPSVFALGNEYIITVTANISMVVWVKIGSEIFYDDANGVLRSADLVHKINVPMLLLDKAEAYTVCFRQMHERKKNGSVTGELKEYSFSFRAIKKGVPVNIYHVSDSHGRFENVIEAYTKSETKADLLVFNGDITSSFSHLENIIGVYRLSGELTKGQIPCIFSRGNHDMRGPFAEKVADWFPTDRGLPYFTFRLGDIWGIVIDSGEDKFDNHHEYGNTICSEAFRKRETAFIKRVCESGEYLGEDIKYRLVICHNPFFHAPPAGNYGYVGNQFIVDDALYTEWCRLIAENIKPHLMLCGHIHKCAILNIGGSHDQRGQFCSAVSGGRPGRVRGGEPGFAGATVVIDGSKAVVTFGDDAGQRSQAEEIELF